VTNKRPGRLARLRAWAKAVKRDVVALWLAARDPRTPWYVKLLAGLVAAYALSPIDLIPDFVPVLGYLDDLVIVPLGIVAGPTSRSLSFACDRRPRSPAPRVPCPRLRR